MAERAEKRIDQLTELSGEFGDTSLIPVEQNGIAYKMAGAKLKAYVEDAVDTAAVEAIVESELGTYTTAAQTSATNAAASATAASAAATTASAASQAVQDFSVSAQLVNSETDFGVTKTVDSETGAVNLLFKNLKGRDGGAVIGMHQDTDGFWVNDINTTNSVWSGGSY